MCIYIKQAKGFISSMIESQFGNTNTKLTLKKKKELKYIFCEFGSHLNHVLKNIMTNT